MLNFGPLTAEIRWRVWGTSANFNGYRVFIGFVTALTSLNGPQPNFARYLAVSCAGTLYIHFRGLLPRNGILPAEKSTLRPSLAFCYIGTALKQWASAKVYGVVQWMELWNFRRGRHLYSAGRPSRWTSAHILVMMLNCYFWLLFHNCKRVDAKGSRNKMWWKEKTQCVWLFLSEIDAGSTLTVYVEFNENWRDKKRNGPLTGGDSMGATGTIAFTVYKYSSKDEIANVNFFTTTSYM